MPLFMHQFPIQGLLAHHCNPSDIACQIKSFVETVWATVDTKDIACTFSPMTYNPNIKIHFTRGKCRNITKGGSTTACIDLKKPFLDTQCRIQCYQAQKDLLQTACVGNDVVCQCSDTLL